MQQNLTSKNATGVDSSDFAKKTDLASLKTNVYELDKLDVDKLKPVPIDVVMKWKKKLLKKICVMN